MKRFLFCHFSLGLALLSAESFIKEGTLPTLRLPDPTSIRFTPPPPPKEVPAIEVKGSTSAVFGTHRITILRGEPSSLPDIPKPPPPVKTDPEVVSPHAEPTQILFISGSTYGESISRVEIWNPETQTRHSAWCGWDVSLVAPFQEIIHQEKSYCLLMGVGPGDASENQPKVEAGSILVPDGDEYTAAILTSMRDVCFQNMPKLLELKAAREQYQKDSDAWKAANPPQPQNHTIWIKPHRGSRYLPKTTDAQKEGTR